jgi:hypothetical protein
VPELTAEQKRNIRTALKVAQRKGATPKERKALVEAMGVESTYRDLNYGDRDSLGILQQRNNGAWGAAKESVATDVGQFLDVARQKNATGKYGSAGSLAQAVQSSGFPDRYQQRSGEADQILAQYGVNRSSAVMAGGKVRAPTTQQVQMTPGVDNSGLRRQLVGQFLQQGGVKNPNAVLGLAAQYGQAADVPGTAATPATTQPQVKAQPAATKGTKVSGSKVLELIFNDGGKGYGIKDGKTVNGQQVFNTVWAGHATHVHVAAGPKTVVVLGRLAQRMGLQVGENPHFGGVDPVHVQGSYHYKGEAIDVSGDEKKMAAFARAVEKYNRTKRLPK